ncbi:MAG: hypothetical protein M3209_19275 [Acidobacteriota bacterium]|nr:hypothetical protein [Acidobacteriota bacterium]
MLHDFELAGRRVRLWQRLGESYEHVLMKALGFAMFVGEFPDLEIEKKVGLRYKPDLVAQNANGDFLFWGECGANSIRKTAWLLKHARVERLVLFKIGHNISQLAEQLRAEIPARYRPTGKLSLINFDSNIVEKTADHKIASVLPAWYAEIKF